MIVLHFIKHKTKYHHPITGFRIGDKFSGEKTKCIKFYETLLMKEALLDKKLLKRKYEMGNGKYKMGSGKYEEGNGKWEIRNKRYERRATSDV